MCFFVDSVNSDFCFDREDFNSLAAEGKATLIFNCIQYAIAKVSEKNKDKERKDGQGEVMNVEGRGREGMKGNVEADKYRG